MCVYRNIYDKELVPVSTEVSKSRACDLSRNPGDPEETFRQPAGDSLIGAGMGFLFCSGCLNVNFHPKHLQVDP